MPNATEIIQFIQQVFEITETAAVEIFDNALLSGQLTILLYELGY